MAWLGVYHELHCIVSDESYCIDPRRFSTDFSTEDASAMELPGTLSSEYQRKRQASLGYPCW